MSGTTVAVRSGRARKLRLVAGALVLLVVAAACEAAPGDFTGDGHADLVSASFVTGQWFTAGNTTPIFTGQAGDLAVAGDYNGDLKWEPAVLRGTAWISSALADPIVYNPANMPAGPPGVPTEMAHNPPPTLLPVPGDYDGTGKTVPAYYDQVDATWWIMGHANPTQFGNPPVDGGTLGYDVPVPADYDGDGHTDIAVFRPTDGSFHYISSKTGHVVVVTPTTDGDIAARLPVPGDYDKVGHAQAAVTDLNSQNWYVEGHATAFATFPVLSTDDLFMPAPAPYNGGGQFIPALIDVDSGAFWLSGQAKPAHVGGNGAEQNFAPVYPDAIIVNFVRLTLYDQLCFDPNNTFTPPAGTCST